MRIFVNGVNAFEAGGWRASVGVQTFAKTPAVIAALHDDVHFFVKILADVRAPECAGHWIEGIAPWIAESNCPEFRMHFRRIGERDAVETCGANEWIVGGHKIIRAAGG